MRKLSRIPALLLALCLLCSASSAALADDCFTYIFQLLSASVEDSPLALGENPRAMTTDPADCIMLDYNLDTRELGLLGPTREDWYLVLWEDVSQGTALRIVYTLSTVYPDLAGLSAEGLPLILTVGHDGDGERMYIDSPEAAEAFCAMLDAYTEAQ